MPSYGNSSPSMGDLQNYLIYFNLSAAPFSYWLMAHVIDWRHFQPDPSRWTTVRPINGKNWPRIPATGPGNSDLAGGKAGGESLGWSQRFDRKRGEGGDAALRCARLVTQALLCWKLPSKGGGGGTQHNSHTSFPRPTSTVPFSPSYVKRKSFCLS